MAKGRKRILGILYGMKTRCTNPRRKDYALYGGRGIKVCDDWSNNSEEFVAWSLQNGYEDNLSIDRVDVDKDYSPVNCRWATSKQQVRNQRGNRLVTISGVTKTCAEWAEIVGISRSAFHFRLESGWTESDLLKPSRFDEGVR